MNLRVTQIKESSVVVEDLSGKRDKQGKLPWHEFHVPNTDGIEVGDMAMLSISFLRQER